jgi:hypothetical protein
MNRIGYDKTDSTQKTIQNTRFANYMLSSYFNESITEKEIHFVSQQPTMLLNGNANGHGLNGNIVEQDSYLTIKTEQERPLEKLQLFQRPFTTVPYLGRGSCDPVLEAQLLQGETVADKKSVSTIMDKSFMGYSLYPTDNEMKERVSNGNYNFDVVGIPTRDITDDPNFRNIHRPTDNSY